MTITLRGTKGTALTHAELDGNFTDLEGQIDAHLADTSDAHDASAISFSATGGISSTDVQAAIAELDTEKLGSSHSSATSSTHGVTGTIVGTSDSQTLTNKTIVVSNNTLTVSAAGVTATELNAALVELAAAIAGLPTVSVQTGYVDTSTLSTSTGEDTRYIDVTISAVSATTNCEVNFMGGIALTGFGDGALAWMKANGTSDNSRSFSCSARLTSTTNLRISMPAAAIYTLGTIQGRWYVIDHGA